MRALEGTVKVKVTGSVCYTQEPALINFAMFVLGLEGVLSALSLNALKGDPDHRYCSHVY